MILPRFPQKVMYAGDEQVNVDWDRFSRPSASLSMRRDKKVVTVF